MNQILSLFLSHSLTSLDGGSWIPKGKKLRISKTDEESSKKSGKNPIFSILNGAANELLSLSLPITRYPIDSFVLFYFIPFPCHCRNNLWIADSFNVISPEWLIKEMVTNNSSLVKKKEETRFVLLHLKINVCNQKNWKEAVEQKMMGWENKNELIEK